MSKSYKLGVVIQGKDRLSPVLGKLNAGLNNFDKRAHKIGGSLQKAGMKSIALGLGLGAGIGKLVSSYQEVARAKGEIASLGIGDSGIEKIATQANIFSNQFAGTTKAQFISAAYDIKSGIASLSDEGVAKFTRLAAITGTATKSTTAEMTKLFALGHGIFRSDYGDDMEFGQKFSAAIAGAVKAFRTDGSDLTLGISNIGAAAKSMGVTLAEELSIIGVAKSSFNSASEAATGYRAFLDTVGKAQKDLGLRFTDGKGKLLPMVKILGKIKDKYGDLSKVKDSDALKKAFGSAEAVKLIKGLIDKTDDLSDAQKTLNGYMAEGTAVTEEMARKMSQGKEFELAKQRIENLSSKIGGIFAPSVLKATDRIGKMVTRLQDWIDKNPIAAEGFAGLAAKATMGALGLGATAIAIGTVMRATKLLTAPIRGVAGLFGKLGGAGKQSCKDIGCISSSAGRAGKSLAGLGQEIGTFRRLAGNPIVFSVMLLGGAAVVAGLSQIAKASKQHIEDKHSITAKKENLGAIKEKDQRLTTRIKSAKGENGWIAQKWEGFTGGARTPEQIKQLEKQRKANQRQKLRAETNWKPPTRKSVRHTDAEISKAKAYAQMMRDRYGTIAPPPIQTTGYTKPVHQTTTIQKPTIQDTGVKEALQAHSTQYTALSGQYQALASTVQTIAARPQQHIYNISVTVNNAKDDQDIQAAVSRAMADSAYQTQQRTMNDL